MILFCNLVCVYVHKIYEDKFGGCKKLSSWIGHSEVAKMKKTT